MPPQTGHSSVSQSTTSSRTSVTASSAYSVPSSLPDTFGVGPLFMWNSLGARRTNSEGSSTVGAHSTLGGTRTSTTGLSVVSGLLRDPPPPSMATSSWVMDKLESLSAARSSITPSQSASNVPPGNITGRRVRAKTPDHMLENSDDETQLKKGDYDVDEGSIPESSGDDEKHQKKNKKSIYIDDEAKGPKRKHPKKSLPRESSANSESEEEPPTKRRKSKATPAKKGGKGKRIPSDESSGEQVSKGPEKWTGATQGRLNLTPKPYNFDNGSSPLWTYSPDGVTRQSPSHRAVGDIHFSPNLGAGPAFHYWVQVGTVDGGCWELYNAGRQHPLYAGYVLTGRKGKYAPGWAFKE
ncbi:hypothetical protein FRC11_005468 [Ceratobasidium sp. 423]|nr:hypothetical protein FRC11_005468 [Ceratobasidium sp. 423]